MNQTQLNEMPVTQEEEEAMQALAKLGGGVDLKEMFRDMGSVYAGGGKTSVMDEVRALGQTIADNTRLEAQAGTLDATEPQPSGENPHNLADIINNICTQLQLLATVISNQPNTTPPEGNQSKAGENSLQDCVATTLQQADWFRTMVRHELVGLDIEDIAKNAVESLVEDEVESYFSHSFDASDHFDFNDAVNDAVSDQIEDAVSDKIDEAVDEYMSNATITICK